MLRKDKICIMQKTLGEYYMKRGIILILILLSFLSLNCQDQRGLIIFGLANELENENWKDAKIGFGLQAIVSEAFSETGKFINLEEKSEIKEQIKKITQQIWENKTSVNFQEEGKKISPEIEFFAYGRVFYYGTPQTKASFGVFHSETTETIIKVEIVLQNRKTQKKVKAKGTGVAKTTANSVVFTVREDVVVFDETTVGKATQEAVSKAVKKIMKKYRKIK